MAENTAKKNLKRFIIIMASGLLILALYLIYARTPLDELTDYRVHVETNPDGSMDITYQYQWKVLDDSREGPLTWVRLGIANRSCEITGHGGQTRTAMLSSNPSEAVVTMNLYRSYYKGETVGFWFKVHQNMMLCANQSNPLEPFYDFTPGWFNDMRVGHYEFTWKKTDNIVSHNADRTEDGNLVWEGSLKKGGQRQMKVSCLLSGFDGPNLVQWKDYQGGIGGDGGVDYSIVIGIIVITAITSYEFSWGSDSENYRRGRGYYARHGRGGYTGRGGGCAGCACACACACAGGGRAGCSKKDFYHSPPPDTETDEK